MNQLGTGQNGLATEGLSEDGPPGVGPMSDKLSCPDVGEDLI